MKAFIKYCLAILLLLFAGSLSAQTMNFENHGFKTIYAGIINKISFDVQLESSKMPLVVEASRGDITPINHTFIDSNSNNNEYYYYSFEPGKVTFKLVGLATNEVVDSVNVNVMRVDDFSFFIYPRINYHARRDRVIEVCEIDSVTVSSVLLNIYGNISYKVAKFKIDIVRKGETIKEFSINGYKPDAKIIALLKSTIKCDDVLQLHSFAIDIAGHTMHIGGGVYRKLKCDD